MSGYENKPACELPQEGGREFCVRFRPRVSTNERDGGASMRLACATAGHTYYCHVNLLRDFSEVQRQKNSLLWTGIATSR